MNNPCPRCGEEVKEGNNYCGKCGGKIIDAPTGTLKYSGLGISSFVLGIIGICTSWFPAIGYSFESLFFFLTLPLSILSIVFGSVSYWGRWKDRLGAVGVILGILAFFIGRIFVMYYYMHY
ncbi:MAG: hypothetical protein KAV40_03500 [Thermoplasmatales archaeon]|nr:hypothetical protein [Thermoplasmatales archaeon]